MTQTVTDADGTIHNFPDDATQEEMEAALTPKPPQSTLQKLRTATGDTARLFLHGATAGTADPLLDKVIGSSTDESAARMGVLGMVPEAVGYSLGPGEFAAAKGLTDLTGSAIMGAGTGAMQSYNEGGISAVPEGAIKGALANVALHPVAGLLQGAGRAVVNRFRQAPKMAGDVAQGLEDAWKPVNSATYGSSAMKATARGARIDATPSDDPMTPYTNKDASKLFDDFEDYANDATQLHSVKELRGWKERANNLTGNDAQYGKVLSDRIDAMLQNGTPATTPKGVLAGHVQATAAADQRGNELLNAYHTNLAANPQTGPGYAADLVRPHSYGIAHHVGMPLGEAAMIGLEAYHHGGVLPAIGTAASTLALQPVINKIADAVSAQGQSTAAAEAMRKAMGKPTIDLRNPIHRLLFGGYLANQ